MDKIASKAVWPGTIEGRGCSHEKATAEFKAPATQWRYGMTRRKGAITRGSSVKGHSCGASWPKVAGPSAALSVALLPGSIRRGDSDFVVVRFPRSEDAQAFASRFAGSRCLWSGDDEGDPKAAIVAERTALTAISIMADLVLLSRARITATEDRRWIIGTAIQIHLMDVRTVRRLRLRSLGQCERCAHDGECECDGDDLRGHGGPPSVSLTACAAVIAAFDTCRFDCSRVAVTRLLRTFW
jgi:hypothetical protein